jgi:hypothetical protein
MTGRPESDEGPGDGTQRLRQATVIVVLTPDNVAFAVSMVADEDRADVLDPAASRIEICGPPRSEPPIPVARGPSGPQRPPGNPWPTPSTTRHRS